MREVLDQLRRDLVAAWMAPGVDLQEHARACAGIRGLIGDYGSRRRGLGSMTDLTVLSQETIDAAFLASSRITGCDPQFVAHGRRNRESRARIYAVLALHEVSGLNHGLAALLGGASYMVVWARRARRESGWWGEAAYRRLRREVARVHASVN